MHLKMHNHSMRNRSSSWGRGISADGLGIFKVLVQVLAVGIKEVLGVLSTNSMDGCRTKPRTGSSVAPVANCNTSLRPTVPLLPPKKQFTSKMDNIFLYIKAKKKYFLRKHCGIHFFVANCVNSSLSIFLISHIH